MRIAFVYNKEKGGLNMTYEEVMEKLEQFGSEQTKKTFARHGAK